MALMTTNVLPSQSYPFGPGSGKTGLRHFLAQIMGDQQEGVMGAGDFKVSQRAAGANMSVDVAAGEAIVQGDDTARQGIYHQTNDAVVNVVVPANASGQPRFDQLILHIYDSSIAGVSDTPQLEVLQGTAQAGVTIDNRLGAASLPNGAVRLAEWVTINAAATITSAIIRDRRPFARGAYRYIKRTTNAAGGSDYTTASATAVDLDATNLAPRIECSGVPLRCGIRGRWRNNTASAFNGLGWTVDGVAMDGVGAPYGGHVALANGQLPLVAVWDTLPTVGSHVLKPTVQVGAGTMTLEASATVPMTLVVEELVRQNADNAGA